MADAEFFEGTQDEVATETESRLEDGWSISGTTVLATNKIAILFTKA